MTSGNARIARNTAIVYIRLAFTMVIGLVMARLVLSALGAEGYGLYNVVGSVVAMFSFISGALSGTTTRFLNYEMGRPGGDENRVFNVCNVLHIACAGILLIIIEILGIIYIRSFLRVAPGMERDAMFVFQVSATVACIGIMNVPFQSLFTAHEKFGVVAVVDIANSLIKLAVVLGLFLLSGNRLRFYAIGMSLTTLLSFVAYHALAWKNWRETVRWKFVRDWDMYKGPLSFNNYNLLSAAATLGRSQGSNMLINFFFGTAVNASYGVANTVLTYINKFIGNFDFASAPQITQGISSGRQGRSIYLTETICRISVLLMLVIFFTLLPELDFIMEIWLGDSMPEGTTVMVACMLVLAVVSSTSAGLTQLINAYGDVKWYKIEYTVLYALGLAVSWILFRWGAPAFSVILVFAAADALSRVIQLLLLRAKEGFDTRHFLRKAYLRPLLLCIVMVPYFLIYRAVSPSGTWGRVAGILATLTVSSVLAFLIGLERGEKAKVMGTLGRKAGGTLRRLGLRYFRKAVIDHDWKKWKGYKVDWKNPRDLNEKIQWLICNGDTSAWGKLADKIAVRDFVTERGLGDLLVPMYGHWKTAGEIPWDDLPGQFVLKCNHDSGSAHVVDKTEGFDKAAIEADLGFRLGRKYGYVNGETYYNSIRPEILAEKFMVQTRPEGVGPDDRRFATLIDYKIWCFDGRPVSIWACYNRTSEGTYVNIYDLDWKCHQEVSVFTDHYRDGKGALPRPEHLGEMLRSASVLSKGFPEVRVDLYDTEGKVWFSEMTFASLEGKMDFYTEDYLAELGSYCKL